MAFDFFADGKEYISASRASERTGYSGDYIGQLCRAKKIPGKLVGRTWYVDLDFLLRYKSERRLGRPRGVGECDNGRKDEFTASVVYQSDSRPLLPRLIDARGGIEQNSKSSFYSSGVTGKLSLVLLFVFVLGIFSLTDVKRASYARPGSRFDDSTLVRAAAFESVSSLAQFLRSGFLKLKILAIRSELGEGDSPREILFPKVTLESGLAALAVTGEAPHLGAVTTAADLRTEIFSYVEARLGQAMEPVVVQSNPVIYNTTVLREEILFSDTRPTVTRQSETDSDRSSLMFNYLTTEGVFDNPTLTNARVSGPLGYFENFSFGLATGTSATTTSLFSTTASSTNLFSTNFNLGTGSIGTLNFSDIIGSNSTTTNATTTSLFSTTASSTNLFSTNFNLGTGSIGTLNFSDIIGSNSTTTNATTTSLFSTTGTFDSLYVNNYQQNSGTFVINSTIPTGNIFSVTNNQITNGTLINQSLTANAGNGEISRGQSINLTDATTAGGGYSAFTINTSGLGSGTGSKTLLTLNPGGSNQVVFDTTGAFRPTTDSSTNTNTIGSPSFYWKNGYFDTLTANNLSGTVVSGATSNNTWTVGSIETGDSYKALIFQRNSGSGNALFQWNAGAGDARFLSVNYPFNSTYTVDDASIATTTSLFSGSLTNNTTSGNQRLLSLSNTGTGTTEQGIYINNTGTGTTAIEIGGTWTNGILTNNNSINTGSGSITTTGAISTGSLLLTGSSTLQNLTFTNATGTSATTTSLFSTTASSTNLFSTNFNLGTGSIGTLNFSDIIGSNSTTTNATTTSLYASIFNAGNATTTSLFSSIGNINNLTAGNLLFTNATGTSATTTSLFSTTASTTNLFSSLLTVGGTNLVVNSLGNVGIGTSTPGTTLDVQGGAQFGTNNVDLITSLGKISGLSSTFFNTDTSDNLATILTDETGSGGGFVRATAPSVTTLTVSSGGINVTGNSTIAGTLGSLTGLTSSGSITFSGLTAGRNVCTTTGGVLTTTCTSSDISNSVTNETGTGALVFGTSPTFTTSIRTPSVTNPGTLALSATGANVITASTNSSERMRIDSSGNVGIGTASPSSLLTVGPAGDTNSVTLPTLRLQGYDINFGSYGGMILHSTSGHTSTARRYLVTNALDGNKFAIIRGANATTDPVIGAGGSLSSGTADFVINNSGNVGIGTASPSFALGTQSKGLHILGAGSTYATLNLQRETNSQGSIIDFSNASNVLQFRIGTNFASGGDKLHFAYGSTPTIGMTLDTSGNVGIGTTTPFSNIFGIDSKLDLTSTGRAILTLHGVLGGNPQEVSLSTGATGFAIDVGGAVSAGSNNIVFRTSNTNSSYSTTERVRITSDGNVGIGTASPQAILNTSVTAGSAGTESTLLRLTKTDGYTSDGTGGSSIVWSNSTNASEFGKIRLTGTGTTRSSLDFIVAGGSVNPTAVAMRIHDSGNVGIGTTNPLNSLHIQNNQNGLTSLRVRNDDTGSSNYSMVAVNSSGNSWGMRMGSVAANNNSLEFVVDAFSSPTPRMTILTGGNVGIGTASPNFKLDVRGTSGNWPAGFYAQGAHYGFTPYTDGGGAGFGYSSTLVMYGAPSATLLYSAGSERMRIDSSGNVGIGTASPQANLEVYRSGSGSANMLRLSRVNGADNHYLNISVDPDNNDAIYSSTGAQGGNHRFFVGNSELMRLSNSLNVSITNLVSCGGIQTNASGVMSCTSDENLKNLGSVYSSGLESIRKIAPQSYSWKEGTPMYDGGILYHGFIAQNIQEALPEAVNVGASGQLQINTTTILASSINAIKDLDLSMQSIESRITALENASSTNDESSSSSLFDSFWQMLADRMASLATSTDAYATSSEEMTGFLSTQFFKTLWSAISVKLAEAANGIERIVARVLEAETVYTNELCLKDSNSENVCVTADQLRLLLSNASGDIDITGGGEGDSAYPSGSGSDISAGESDNTSSTEPEQEPQTSEPPAETDSPEGDTGENQGI